MTRYQTSTPRAMLAIAAAALTAVTLSLAVIAPATIDATRADVRQLAGRAVAAPPTEVAIFPARIDVIGTREPEVASSRDKGIPPNPQWPG